MDFHPFHHSPPSRWAHHNLIIGRQPTCSIRGPSLLKAFKSCLFPLQKFVQILLDGKLVDIFGSPAKQICLVIQPIYFIGFTKAITPSLHWFKIDRSKLSFFQPKKKLATKRYKKTRWFLWVVKKKDARKDDFGGVLPSAIQVRLAATCVKSLVNGQPWTLQESWTSGSRRWSAPEQLDWTSLAFLKSRWLWVNDILSGWYI